jgi:hypothetical protein
VRRADDRGQQLAEAERVVLVAHDADQLGAASGGGQPGVEPGLDVDVLVAGPALLHDLEGRGAVPEELGEDARERDPLVGPRRADHGPHDPAQQPPDVGELRPQLLARGRAPGVDARPVGHPACCHVGGP